MIFQPLIPEWLIVVAAVVLITASLWRYRWWHPLLLLRLPAAIVILVMLANPVEQTYKEREARQQLAIIVDSSKSMARTDTPSGESRYAVASKKAEEYAERLSAQYTTQVYGFDERLQSTLPDQASGNSNFNGLKHLSRLGHNTPDQLLLFSDGADWKDSNPEKALTAASMMVHSIGIGSRAGSSNVSIQLEASSPTMFPGQNLPINCEILASDDLTGRETEWVFYAIAEDGTETELHREICTLKKFQRRTIISKSGNVIGGRLWRAEIKKLPGETYTEDNQSYVSAQVVDKEIGILVVQGKPYWDTSIAVRAWRRDKQLRVTSWYALGSKIYRSGHDVGTRLDPETLKKVDILVLGKDLDVFIKEKEIEHIKEFINAGGNILLIGPGRRLEGRIDDILPYTATEQMKEQVPFTLNSVGRRLDLLNVDEQGLGMVSSGVVSDVNPHALIYAGTPADPLIISIRHGNGKLTCVNIESLWKWRLAHREGGDNPASFLWRQLIRTMARQVHGVFSSDRNQYTLGQESIITIRDDEIKQVLYTDPDGQEHQCAVVDQQLVLKLDQPGLHIVRHGDERLLLVARNDNAEEIRSARDNRRLERFAAMTDGSFHDIQDSDVLIDRLLQQQALAQSSEVSSSPLITEGTWLFLVLLFLGIEWTVRRTIYGMV